MMIRQRKAKFSNMTKKEYITRINQLLEEIEVLPYGKSRVSSFFKVFIYSLNFLERFPEYYDTLHQQLCDKIVQMRYLWGDLTTRKQQERLDHYYRRLIRIGNASDKQLLMSNDLSI